MTSDDRQPDEPPRVAPVTPDSAGGPPLDAPGHGAPRVHPIDGRRREWTLASHPHEPPADLS
jgi:hypothetical protein